MPEHNNEDELSQTMKDMVASIQDSMEGAPIGFSVTLTVIWPRGASHSVQDYEFTIESTREMPVENWEGVILGKIEEAVDAIGEPRCYPTALRWHGNPTPNPQPAER